MKNVLLLKKHKHNGILYEVGTVLSMSDKPADWLVEQNIARYSDSIRIQNRQPAPRVRRGCCGRW